MASEPFVLRPDWRRRWDVWSAGFIGAVSLGLAGYQVFDQPSQALAWLLIAALFVGGQAWTYGKSFVEVGDDAVVVRSVAGQRAKLPRSEVKSVQMSSYWQVLRDQRGKTLVRMRPYWSRRQLQDLSAVLGVPFVDRRKWFHR